MLDRRVTYKRRHCYRTKTNRFRTLKTPGGKLAIQYIKKNTHGTGMAGVKVRRPAALRGLKRHRKSVSRAYGGQLTHQEVRDRITRAFMIEEINSIKMKNALGDGKKKKKGGKGKKKTTKQ